MRVRELRSLSLIACEFFALTALYLTDDVKAQWFLAIPLSLLFVFILKVVRGARARQGLPLFVILGAYVALFIVAGVWISKRTLVPLHVVSSLAPLFVSLIWLGPKGPRLHRTRIALSFVTLTLACALSPSSVLAPIIFLFMVAAALCLLALFLESQAEAPEKLPRHFLSLSSGIVFTVLVLSIAIFPILPRKSNLWGASGSETRVGYSEELDLSHDPLWGRGNDRVAIRMSAEHGIPNPPLLKARFFDRFDGSKWHTHKSSEHEPTPLQREGLAMEIALEPIGSPALFVPYGTRELILNENKQTNRVRIGDDGYFRLAWPSYRTLRYNVFVAAFPRTPAQMQFQAQPHELEVPEWVSDPKGRWMVLASDLFKETRNSEQKVRALREFLKKSGYKAEFGSHEERKAQTYPQEFLESFFFEKKSGYCQQFASSSAFLLRLGGVPTRLVSGFRISKKPSMGIVTIRQSDAHAWVEYLNPRLGWLPLDPTPFTHRDRWSETKEFLSSIVDIADALWSKYVVGLGDGMGPVGEAPSPQEQPQNRKPSEQLNFGPELQISSLITFLIFMIFALRHLMSINAKLPLWLRWQIWSLQRIYYGGTSQKIFQWEEAHHQKPFQSTTLNDQWTSWFTLYHRFRFSKSGQTEQKELAHALLKMHLRICISWLSDSTKQFLQ